MGWGVTFYFKFHNGTTDEAMKEKARKIARLRGVYGVAPMFPGHAHERMRTMFRIEGKLRKDITDAVAHIRELDSIEYAEAPVMKNFAGREAAEA